MADAKSPDALRLSGFERRRFLILRALVCHSGCCLYYLNLSVSSIRYAFAFSRARPSKALSTHVCRRLFVNGPGVFSESRRELITVELINLFTRCDFFPAAF